MCLDDSQSSCRGSSSVTMNSGKVLGDQDMSRWESTKFSVSTCINMYQHVSTCIFYIQLCTSNLDQSLLLRHLASCDETAAFCFAPRHLKSLAWDERSRIIPCGFPWLWMWQIPIGFLTQEIPISDGHRLKFASLRPILTRNLRTAQKELSSAALHSAWGRLKTISNMSRPTSFSSSSSFTYPEVDILPYLPYLSISSMKNPPAPEVQGAWSSRWHKSTKVQVYLGGVVFFGKNILFLIGRDAPLHKTL